jgi:hypothetical protein
MVNGQGRWVPDGFRVHPFWPRGGGNPLALVEVERASRLPEQLAGARGPSRPLARRPARFTQFVRYRRVAELSPGARLLLASRPTESPTQRPRRSCGKTWRTGWGVDRRTNAATEAQSFPQFRLRVVRFRPSPGAPRADPTYRPASLRTPAARPFGPLAEEIGSDTATPTPWRWHHRDGSERPGPDEAGEWWQAGLEQGRPTRANTEVAG